MAAAAGGPREKKGKPHGGGASPAGVKKTTPNKKQQQQQQQQPKTQKQQKLQPAAKAQKKQQQQQQRRAAAEHSDNDSLDAVVALHPQSTTATTSAGTGSNAAAVRAGAAAAAAASGGEGGGPFATALDVAAKLKGWRPEQVTAAVKSLLKWVGQRQSTTGATDLFAEDEDDVVLQLALRSMPQTGRKDKPVALPLPHPIYAMPGGAGDDGADGGSGAGSVEVCLIVKDDAGGGHKGTKQRLAKLQKNGGVAKVISVSKLRSKYESHEARRQLCRAYDLFLADARVLRTLPKLLGKSFFKKKKQPIPVDLTSKDWAAQFRRATRCTYMHTGSGTSVAIKVGRTGQPPAHIAANVHAALAAAAERLPKKWAALQGVYLKTPESVALPLLQALPDAPVKI